MHGGTLGGTVPAIQLELEVDAAYATHSIIMLISTSSTACMYMQYIWFVDT